MRKPKEQAAVEVEPAKGQYYPGGGYRPLQIGLLFNLAPAEAVRRLRALLNKHAGSTTAAAKATGINVATIKRWCAKARDLDPQFEAQLAAMREGAGDRVA